MAEDKKYYSCEKLFEDLIRDFVFSSSVLQNKYTLLLLEEVWIYA